ncbi:hypothetical protein ASZ90_014124 [hydrocarbon metagenome]|uniref:Uncharacterized protein n=1 Tax=hydrocarbon metagenome TaxID=938273 RepID=A0A0W8F5L8_9ZZZZ
MEDYPSGGNDPSMQLKDRSTVKEKEPHGCSAKIIEKCLKIS